MYCIALLLLVENAVAILPPNFVEFGMYGSGLANPSRRDSEWNFDACHFVTGDGIGGTETKIGEFTGDECVEKCRLARFAHYNGVTVKKDGSAGCWCEKGMTGVKKSSDSYKTCFIRTSSTAESSVGDADEFMKKENDKLRRSNTALRAALESLAAN